MTESASPRSLARRLHFWARNASNESAMLHSAVRLGVFSTLTEDGPGMPLAKLASQVQADARGVRSLVEPLIAMGFLRQPSFGHYALAPGMRAVLGDPAFQSAIAPTLRSFGAAGLLEQAVKTGGPVPHAGAPVDVLAIYRRAFLEAQPSFESPLATDLYDRFARSYLRTQALITAGALGVLTELWTSPAPVEALAPRLGVHPNGLAVLLQVLQRMELLTEEAHRWGPTAEARSLLDEKGLAYFVRSLPVSAQYWDALEALDETIRRRKYVLDLKDAEVSRKFYAENSNQITGVFASHFQISRRAALTVDAVKPLAGAQVLDIGTGSGVWGAAFATTNAGAHVTYFDQPVVLEQVQRNLQQLKLDGRAKLWGGNLFQDEFGEAQFDVIVLPQVLNVLVPEDLPGIFRRVAKALKPDGILVIAEYVLDDLRDGPLDHLYFGFRRFITNEGDLLSFREYSALLREVGLTEARCFPLPTQELIVAARAGTPLPEALAPELPRKSAARAERTA